MALFQLPNGDFLHYEVIPNILPENTVFIHGNLASNRWWYPTEQEARKFYKGRSLKGAMILVEFLGCGKSSNPRQAADVNMRVFAKDFIDLLASLKNAWSEFGISEDSKFHLVGHSTGGLIAALMLARQPDLFSRAVLLDPVGAQGVQFDDSMIGAFQAMKNDKALTAQVIGSTIYENNPESDFFKQIVVEDAFHAVQTVGHWVLQALSGLDIRDEVSKVPNEVLVLHGEFDVLLSKEESQKLSQLMSRSTFEIFEGQGHCPNAENPEAFFKKMNTYLFR